MKTISIKDALNLNNKIFVDVRTESEHKEDNILDAINIPLFTDEEHKEIGTIYKTKGKEEAVQRGFDFVSYKLKDIYLQIKNLEEKYENIIIYCARGGMRSTSVASMLSSVGLNIFKVEGGYKSYRNFVINYLNNIMNTKNFIVVHGLTGAGKTDLLNLLEERQIDNIDLEGIAKNSGSTFGFITFDKKPPSQKQFESKIFEKIFFSNTDYIFIESESKRVGHVLIPDNIYEAIIRDGYHLLIESSLENRVKRLCRDYVYNRDEENLEVLKNCILKFKKRLGNEKVNEYISLLENKQFEELVEKYLVEYYDPLYNHSVQKYKYNKIIDFNNEEKALNEVEEFHKILKENK